MSEEKQTYELISELLKRKDPALVGIRKILRGKSGTLSPSKSFSAHAPEVFNLATEGKSRENETIFNDNEVQTLEFEKKILELQNIISQKEVEIEAAKSTAFAEGKSVGIAENQEKTRAVIEEIENKMKTEVQTRLVQQINQELADRKEYFNSLEEDFYQTIKAITRKILATEIQTNPYLIISTIKKAISYISQKDGIKIRVSQDDYEYVKSNIFSFNHNNDGTFKVEIIEDEHIKTGGCLISTASTIVDAQLEKRAENVFEFVEKIWNESKNDDKKEEIIEETEEIQDVSEQETLPNDLAE